MRAGLLKDTIIFQSAVETVDAYGGKSYTYSDVITTRARVQFHGGNREDSNNELHYAYTVEFTIRGYHQVNEDMIVVYMGKKYRILSIDDTIREQKTIITELINE